MWAEAERSPALAAPGSNNYGNVGRSTDPINGKPPKKKQALSDAQFELVRDYLPLAYSLTGPYHGKGLSHDELVAGAEDGLLGAAINFNPALGFPFAAYARPCIKGGIRALFKKKKFDKLTCTVESIPDTAEAPVVALGVDLGGLNVRERYIVEENAKGETLKDIGKKLDISAERVRQIGARARTKLVKHEPCLRVAPRDMQAKLFRDEYIACHGKFRSLQGRSGYRKPSRQLLPFRSVTYPCRTYTAAEIEAYERGEL